MRRLRSSFTLLSTDETPPHPSESEVSYDHHHQGSSEPLHFTWDELFAGDPPDSTPYYQASPYPEYPFDEPPLFSSSPKYSGDGEDYLQDTTVEEEEEEILPSDSEHSYSGGPHPPLPPSLSERNQHPSITPYGTVSILIRHLVRVDVSPAGAVMVRNYRSGSTAVVGASGERSCINHGNARVYQDGPEVHVMTCQGRLAKICQRGVVFTASTRSLAYLVDESGTKSTADRFVDLRRDFTFDVFSDLSCGPSSCADCFELLANSAYKPLTNGDDVWRIGGAAVKQDRYGNVEVAQDRRRRVLTLLPTVDELSLLSEDGFSATVGSYSKRYLTAQAASRRITAGYCGLTAKSGSQKAGIDRNGKVAIL